MTRHRQPPKSKKKHPFKAISGQDKVVNIAQPARQELRIIAGHWRGRKVPFTAVSGLRPTSDRVRETLFNWLAPILPGATCLDLFAGTGALGLEALSRDAADVDMVELSQVAKQQLEQNLATLPLQENQQVQVHNMSCFDWLRQTNKTYDVVFLDPPFALSLMDDVLALLQEASLLREGSLIYIEQPKPLANLSLPKHWHLHRQKKAGQVHYGVIRVEA
ncbi:MAG TPA: 16S rRNA (guanine(966)-N(2))-methyltransferase RsmD [Oceanospirillaceae bacterium]|jgi:16S rRNA (guanine966-N2)-methyltransferase|nr:16S rRNA (guanine(966)-N(2))-methyltransferase RsmD [Oceanospirillaceae bacterium]|tara:strand:- start:324 stop:980 length:657 start_codon:yes stop_codon:yes gene_type:complete